MTANCKNRECYVSMKWVIIGSQMSQQVFTLDSDFNRPLLNNNIFIILLSYDAVVTFLPTA